MGRVAERVGVCAERSGRRGCVINLGIALLDHVDSCIPDQRHQDHTAGTLPQFHTSPPHAPPNLLRIYGRWSALRARLG